MENRPIFDPYAFGPGYNLPPNMSLPPNISLPPNMTGGQILPPSPIDFYNNQYYYYRCLNEYLDYSIKSAEYEKRFGTQNTQKGQ